MYVWVLKYSLNGDSHWKPCFLLLLPLCSVNLEEALVSVQPGATPQKVAIWCWHNVIFGLHGINIQHSKNKFSVNTCERRWLTMSYFILFSYAYVFLFASLFSCVFACFFRRFLICSDFQTSSFLFSVVSRLDLSKIYGQPGFNWHIPIIWLCPKLG
jgi:hypothetical protein